MSSICKGLDVRPDLVLVPNKICFAVQKEKNSPIKESFVEATINDFKVGEGMKVIDSAEEHV
ncbi:hypothetical protein TSUD_215380 [Trifolium subterraneum]|uniref:Uncharacterized protein n=1 Tax=Trifolium subterraneum TaxID=3900 RepID=A0A2Z6N7W7_TRISU|nr:hypothetical protein TSUD_215380 [Trifolium subterraneum]